MRWFKIIISVMIVTLLLLTACGFGAQTSNASNSKMANSDSNKNINSNENIITVHAKQFEFIPATITVKKGASVTIRLISDDVAHGIAIPELGLNLKAQEIGKPFDATIIPAKSGTYPFFCNVFCGSDHKAMKGTLIVED